MNDSFNNRDVDKYLTAMRAGDETAFEKLYDCVSKPLFALCYSYFHNVHDAEDALSEALITVRREISKYNGTSGFNWIYTIAKNICLKGVKKHSRIHTVDFTDTVEVDKYYGATKTESPSAFDESGIITICRKVLKDSEYEVVIYHAVYGMPFKDIAAFTGKIEATVRWQYHNAINKVRKEYQRRSANEE